MPPDAPLFLRRADLVSDGWSGRALTTAVLDGRLLRVRSGVYLASDAPPDVVDACAAGGRLACVSALTGMGVFALDATALHLHHDAGASRLPGSRRALRRHWGRLHRPLHPRATRVDVFDALVQATRCQAPRAAVATLDSALQMQMIDLDALDELFEALPVRLRVLRGLIEPRCQSGPETLVRLMLRALRAAYDVQVRIAGVGIVDFLVDGWLIIECDSRAHHSTWDAQRRDRRRDQAAAALGFATFRPIAEDILWNPDVVLAALRSLLAGRHRRRSFTFQETHHVGSGLIAR